MRNPLPKFLAKHAMKFVAKPMTKFVTRHKMALTISATVTICYAIHRVAMYDHDHFLTERGLYDAFYHPVEPDRPAL